MKWQDDKTLKGVLQTKAETFIKKSQVQRYQPNSFFITLNMIFFFFSVKHFSSIVYKIT